MLLARVLVNDKADARPDKNEPKGGTIIADRYVVDRLIARGGMAAVYLAHHVNLNRPVALKILSPPPDAEDPHTFEDRFRLEASTLASLDHPNIVILHDFGETSDGRFFLAMEYVDGLRVSDMLKDGPLPVERALQLCAQVCAALKYAHKRGVTHRDLKPSNLLVRIKDGGEEQVKVVDFGLVKLKETDQSITRAGLILGSPHCMAPEQIKGMDVDPRTDVYAVGILIFRSITGQYPFHGPNSAATMIAHLNQPVPTFFSVAPELVVPAGLEEIVRKCLEKTPEARFQSMNDLLAELVKVMGVPPEAYRTSTHSSLSAQRAHLQLPPNNNRAGLAMIGAALFGIMVTVIGIVAVAIAIGMFGSSGEPAPVPPPAVVTTQAPVVAPPSPPVVAEPAVVTPVPEPPPVEPPPEATTPEAPVDPAPPVQPKPKPKPKPKPAAASTTPPETKAPETQPETPKPDAPKDPEGYMGLPDDFK